VTTWWGSEARRWQFSGPLLIGGVAAATSSGVESGPDLRLERAIEAGTTNREAAVARGFTRLGDASTGAVLLGGSYLVARWTGNERLAEATSLSAEALLNSGMWNELLKHTLSRTRPAGGNRGAFFQYQPPPGGQSGSFPSGHAMGAFAVATVFADAYDDHRWMPWLAYGTATLISVSRVSLGRHFPSDVMVGALLGNSLGRMVLARRDGTTTDGDRGGFELMADPSGRAIGASFHRRW
jgi:membrane-associated phospholipid phosphatase